MRTYLTSLGGLVVATTLATTLAGKVYVAE
jgi:hypothetical protein